MISMLGEKRGRLTYKTWQMFESESNEMSWKFSGTPFLVSSLCKRRLLPETHIKTEQCLKHFAQKHGFFVELRHKRKI